MGSGQWSASDYNTRAQVRQSTGTDAFAYSAKAEQSGNYRPHQTLDPQGLNLRESCDSPEHPTSNSIIISLDVTGSMGKVCRAIHDDLPHLLELLLGHKYIPDPQIMFAAVGDATCDRVPLQIGQFESDNRMDHNLENMILEGGGGGQKTESYELMLYIAARHTKIDCWEKRQHKGYLFIIGDEMAYPKVSQAEVRRLLGKDIGEDIALQQIAAEAKAKYNVYFVLPGGASYGHDKQMIDFWRQLLGPQSVIELENPEDVSQCIAMAIGINEGTITMNKGVEHMQNRGLVSRAIDRVTQALGSMAGNAPAVPLNRPRRL